jgi:uncharacterized protein YciI
MRLFLFIFCILILPTKSFADEVKGFKSSVVTSSGSNFAKEEVILQNDDGRRCFSVLNKAPYTIHGSFYTNFYMTSSGTPGRHQSNFMLKEGQRDEFCSYGPFLGENNDRLYLVLRTLIPIFSCKFRAEGELIIFGRKKAEGGTETWASCD